MNMNLVQESIGDVWCIFDELAVQIFLLHNYCKLSEMTYNVSMGTLNPTIPYHTILSMCFFSRQQFYPH